MKTLFVCATPYHILNSINFINNDSSVCDICISPDFENVENIVTNLRLANIFENVFVLNEANKSYTQKKSFMRLLLGSRYIKELFKKRVYDKIFYCFTNPVLYTLISQELKKYNKNLKCYFIEDGIGSYTAYLERVTPRMRLIYRLLNKQPVGENLTGAYFHKPELVKKGYGCEYLTLSSMNRTKNDPALLGKINDVLGYRTNLLYERRMIYLNQPLSQDGIADIGTLETRALCLFAKMGLNPVIKCHPRFTDIDSFKDYDVISENTPLELVMINHDMSGKILVTPFSTAAITPKLIFDQEPVVIFLYRLYHLDESLPQIKEVEDFILSVKKTYSDPNRVQIPRTFEELTAVLKRFGGHIISN
jgi:hypothetical protein